MTGKELAAQYPDLVKYVNVEDYTLTGLALILIGTILWNVAYYVIIRNAFRNKYVDMPVAAGASNLAWEFVWGFMVETDLGLVFVWGLRIWFFLDLFIFWNILKYGHKQLTLPSLIKYFKPIEIALAVSWGFIFYFFIKEGRDTAMGATSAYMITVIMAVLYIFTFMWSQHKQFHSRTVAWCKGVGNLLMTVFVFMHYPHMNYLLALTVVVTILNSIYIFQIHSWYKSHAPRVGEEKQAYERVGAAD